MKVSTRDNTKKVRIPRPAQTGQLVGVRLQPHDLSALDAFSSEAAEPVSRPQAIRAILSDWLATHGFLKRGDHPKPTGPATDVIEAMDAAIKEHKSKRKK